MAKPNFIGIGAQKCASTWLHGILSDHPEVGVSEKKEIDFFSHHYNHGFQWYERHFEECSQQKVFGENSPSYFCEKGVPERVRDYAPDIKIILSIRDPIKRAISNHKHEVRVGHFAGEDLSFEAGLNNNPMYIEQGRYATHLNRWLSCFDREQMLVVIMDDIYKDPLAVAQTVYKFLEIDETLQPAVLDKKFNRSFVHRHMWLSKVKDSVYQYSQKPGLRWTWNIASSLGLKSLYRKTNVMSSEAVIPAPKPETVAMLRNEFKEEIVQLEDMLNRSFDIWR